MSKRDCERAPWRGSMMGACIALVGGALLIPTLSLASDGQPTISDRYILDELRVSEILLKRAIGRRQAGVIAFSSSEKFIYSDILGELASGQGQRSPSCMRALDALGVVGHVAANILEPNQIAPLYPPEKEMEGLDNEWAAYRDTRKECERSLGVASLEVLPERLTEAIKSAPAPLPRVDTPPIDPEAFSARYPLDRLRELEFRLRDAIIRKSGTMAASVANQLFVGDDLNWLSPTRWPSDCRPSPTMFGIASLLAAALLDPQRTSHKDPAEAKVEMDRAWGSYCQMREACERSLGVSPVKILPDRLSEAF